MTKPLNRSQYLLVAGKKLPLPCFFPSVSSTTKSDLSPAEHVEILSILEAPRFLVSAYDIERSSLDCKQKIMQSLEQSINNGAIVFMDSGNYEKDWKKDESWTQEQFHEVLQMCLHDICLSYDNELHPKGSVEGIVNNIEISIAQHRKHTHTFIVPIVHQPSGKSPKLLPEMLKMAAEKLCPALISVPERDLGKGFFNRIQSIRKIRLALDELGMYYPLHLLGVSHPLSLIAYAMAGADSFDGLLWCRAAIDPTSGQLFDFHHGDLFLNHMNLDESVSSDLNYYFSIIESNLNFYDHLMKEVREAVHGGNKQDLLKRYAPNKSTANLILQMVFLKGLIAE